MQRRIFPPQPVPRTVVLLAILVPLLPASAGEDVDPPKTRRFVLRYEAGVRDVPADARVRLWLPLWHESPYQQMHGLRVRTAGTIKLTRGARYGNQFAYAEWTGPVRGAAVQVELELTRTEVRAPVFLGVRGAKYGGVSNVAPVKLSPEERGLYLSPSRLVPVGGPAVQLLKGLPTEGDQVKLAYRLYQKVLDHMTYRKVGTGWGRGSVAWACQAGYGNCTDFHSLFLAMVRYFGIPARFVIGFPLPEQRGSGTIPGYHCWAYFHVDGIGWVPVDISEADKYPPLAEYYFGNLTENRVALSVGRDIVLEPAASSGPLNYFVYPHVEIDGTPARSGQVWWRVSFRDVEEPDVPHGLRQHSVQ